jgi:hypothetical protein
MAISYDHIDQDRADRRRGLIDDTVFGARKSGLIAYLLWAFLGSVGMHNFYLCRPKAAGLQMAGTLFVYCTYPAEDPWPLIGLIVGIPLAVSLLVDLFLIPGYVVACSERLRARLQDNMADWRGA